jgi:hypothetical protein
MGFACRLCGRGFRDDLMDPFLRVDRPATASRLYAEQARYAELSVPRLPPEHHGPRDSKLGGYVLSPFPLSRAKHDLASHYRLLRG